MSSHYEDWIQVQYGDDTGYGQCAARTLEMQAAFPELLRERGYYYCPTWGRRTHWWLVTTTGEIIDPTKRQFPSGGSGSYEPLPADQPEPIGRCLGCGELIFPNDYSATFCSEYCCLETRADMGI